MNELKNRGVQGVLIAVVDGLKGFPEAITAASRMPWSSPGSARSGLDWSTGPIPGRPSPCIVHLVRHSLNFCSWPYGECRHSPTG